MLRRDWLKSMLVGLLVLLQQFFGVTLRLDSDENEEQATMRIWLDVYNPNHTVMVADGPIFLRSAQVRRGLDETGSCSVDLVGIDPRVVTYLAPRNVCEIWVHEDGFDKRRMGTFVIEGDNHTITAGSNARGVSGRSSMLALIDEVLLPGLSYEAQTVETVIDALAAMAGWTADVDASIASDTISVQFAGGESVFKALQVVCEIKGVHLRESASVGKEIEIGPFGDDAGVWIDYMESDGGEIHRRSDSPLLIEQMQIQEESAEIFNYVVGFAGGSGDAAIDLGLSTRGFVETVSANGRTHYIIKDNLSVAVYGKIMRRVDAKRIVPTDTTDSALEYAANAAADAIKAKLDRHKEPQQIYSVMLRNVRTNIQPGDKIHLTYQGMVNKHNVPYKWIDINADFWVMRAVEVVRTDGPVLQLILSNLDRYQADAAGVIVGMIDALQAQEVDVQPYPAKQSWGPFQQPIDTSEGITFKFPIFDDVLRLNSVVAYISRDVWKAVSGVATGGGNHKHKIAEYQSFSSPFNSALYANGTFHFAQNGNPLDPATATFRIPTSALVDMYTFEASGDHTHAIAFDSVQKDTVKPENLAVTVNGVSVDTGLFPDDASDKYVDADIVKLDITDAVLGKAGGYRAWHEMVISCGTNRGDISVVFQIDADISKVRTT